MLYDQYFTDVLKARADLVRIVLIVAVAISIVAACFGQESTEPILVDEFSKLPCGDLTARVDMLFAEINANPGSTGYILVSSEPESRAIDWERWMDGRVSYRGIEPTKVMVHRANLGQKELVQLWRVPVGAKFSSRFLPDSEYQIPKMPRKQKFYSDLEEVGTCYTGAPFRLLAKYFRINDGWNANIAIGAPSSKDFTEEKKSIIGRFETEYGVDRSRLKFFNIKGKFYSIVHEIWLVRRK